MNLTQLKQANQDWENFVANLSDEEKKGLIDLMEPIGSNNLYYYVAIKDTQRFDQTINKLSNRYLYDEELIPTVYRFYSERDLHEVAFNYIKKAEKHLIESGITISKSIQNIITSSESSYLLKSLKSSLEIIGTLIPKNLPLITPEIINDKRELNEFILSEIIQASKVMLEKIQGIKTIPHEDRYNDLVLATLRLRFAIWGWSIHDQPRIGSSPTGKNAGEADIIIQVRSITIALFEAFILKGRNKSATQKHVLKSFLYAKNLERYYMIVYFKGDSTNFDKTWDSYMKDVSASKFTPSFLFNEQREFEDLSAKFDDVSHFKIAKSSHGKNVEMFHIMIDLSK